MYIIYIELKNIVWVVFVASCLLSLMAVNVSIGSVPKFRPWVGWNFMFRSNLINSFHNISEFDRSLFSRVAAINYSFMPSVGPSIISFGCCLDGQALLLRRRAVHRKRQSTTTEYCPGVGVKLQARQTKKTRTLPRHFTYFPSEGSIITKSDLSLRPDHIREEAVD